MTRSERLAKESKVDTVFGIADVVSVSEMNSTSCSYVGTDNEVMYNAREASVDVYAYDDKQGFCAVVYMKSIYGEWRPER